MKKHIELHQLDCKEWGEIYNNSILDQVISDLTNGRLSYQSKEMFTISQPGDKILELGCGSGATSVYLAMNGRKVTAVDFSDKSIKLTESIWVKMQNLSNGGGYLKCILSDVTKKMPFENDEYDLVFQAGLLEHFDKNERIRLLNEWSLYGNLLVSIIPNAGSLAYRVGKQLMEEKGIWEYGVENPQYSMKEEFYEAGLAVIKEYTIGEVHSLQFLPKRHYLRRSLEKWMKSNSCNDNCGQGYLLVTIGKKINRR